MGVNALLSNTTASNNVAFGASAMRCNTTGSSNTALGINALCANVEGDQSVAVGINALQNQNPVGNADMNNVAVGLCGCPVYDDGRTNNTAVGSLCAAVEHDGRQQHCDWNASSLRQHNWRKQRGARVSSSFRQR
jgi:hypothetical protein